MNEVYQFNGKRCSIVNTRRENLSGGIAPAIFIVRYEDGTEEDVRPEDFRSAQLQNTAEALVKFEEALQHPEFRHVSARVHVGQSVLHVYKSDRTSPSGCHLIGSAMDDDAARALLAKYGKRTHQGGMMGEMAARRMMTGR